MDEKRVIPRRRFKQTLPLRERLLIVARDARARALQLPPGPERDASSKRRAKPSAEPDGPLAPSISLSGAGRVRKDRSGVNIRDGLVSNEWVDVVV
jgi:hypothetical protein